MTMAPQLLLRATLVIAAAAHAVLAALPICGPASSSGWGSSYEGKGELSMPPNVYVDFVANRPPGPLTVENHLMYIKVRSHSTPGWGSAGLQVINITSGTWLGTLWSPGHAKEDTSQHSATASIPLRILDSKGPVNLHIAYYSARASNGSTLLHAAIFATYVEATGPAWTDPGARINRTTGAVIEPPQGLPVMGFAWVRSIGGPGVDDALPNPALFDSLTPGEPLPPASPDGARQVGFLAVTGLQQLYVIAAGTGELLYAHSFPDRVLRPSARTFDVPPVNFAGLAVFPTSNNSIIAFNLASREVAWEAAFPSSVFTSIQVSADRLLVRIAKPSSAPGSPYYSVSPDGTVQGFNPDPSMGFSTPHVSNPLSPVTPDGVQFTLLNTVWSAPPPRPPPSPRDEGVLLSPPPPSPLPHRPQRIGMVDLRTLERREVELQFTMRYPPLPPAMAYDSCRLVIYGTGFAYDDDATNGESVVTTVHVADIATGALIWSKRLRPVEPFEDSLISHPYVDPMTGSIYLLRNQELFRWDPSPAKPAAQPLPSASPSPPAQPSPALPSPTPPSPHPPVPEQLPSQPLPSPSASPSRGPRPRLRKPSPKRLKPPPRPRPADSRRTLRAGC